VRPIAETAVMRGMTLSDSDWTVLFGGPNCGTLMLGSFAAPAFSLLREALATRRRTAELAIPGEQR
jgi:hypothetical protein